MRSIVILMISILCFASVDVLGNTRETQEAQIAGETDAKGLKGAWFAAGYMAMSASVIVLILGVQAKEGYATDLLRTIDNNLICFSGAYGAYILAPTAIAILHTATPPADRLLGKSPDWINAYTKAYQKNMRRYRAASTLVGGCVGGAVLGATLYLLYPNPIRLIRRNTSLF